MQADMFWKFTALSAPSPVDAVLDKENFTLDELLDEEEIIQECKALNSHLINFLRDKAQVEQLLHYIVKDPPEGADSKRTFKFSFIACEIFTCEIDVILKTLVEEEELMDLLFSFLEPDRHHSALLAGYFSKVVICLMLRKTLPLMHYVKDHQDIFKKMVDLIGITSIMEVLVRLVGSDDHIYPNSLDVMQWLSDSNLLEMIVDKLNATNPPEVHSNAAEILCAITRTAPSPLATKLSSPSFVLRIFGHALEDYHSKSALVNSLSVCISLLDPRRSIPSSIMHPFRNQHGYEPPVHVNPDTLGAMLPKLGELLMLLSVSSDDKILPTTYGELKPPLGKHRLKIVEFLVVLLKTGNDMAENELVSSGTIRRVLDLFFESMQPTLPSSGRRPPRSGYFGHITGISNKLIQLGNNNNPIQSYLQENGEWKDWQGTVLQERNMVENVHRWACGRPTTLQDRTRDSDEEDVHDRDYDLAALANNLSQAFRYSIYENDDAEAHGSLDRDDEDVYFDDESAEVVISSLQLGDDQGRSLFTNSNWFAFQDDRNDGSKAMDTSSSDSLDDLKLNGTSNGNSSSDDEVVVEEDMELALTKTNINGSSAEEDLFSGFNASQTLNGGDSTSQDETNAPSKDETKASSRDLGFFNYETSDGDNPSGNRPVPEWESMGATTRSQAGGSSVNPFDEPNFVAGNETYPVVTGDIITAPGADFMSNDSSSSPNSGDGSSKSASSQESPATPSLFEDDVEFVGVEFEGTEKAMEQALKEGIVGEAGPLRKTNTPKTPEKEDSGDASNMKEYNDTNYWRVDQEVAVSE